MQLLDQSLHDGVGLQQLRINRQQSVAEILDLALAEMGGEKGQNFSVRAGVGDEGDAAGVVHENGLRHGVMGVASEDDVDTADAARELQVDVHAVMRQQNDGVDLVLV